jgi:hypothetical protein
MDENLNSLWEQLSPHYDIGTLPEFKKMLSDPANRKAFYDQVAPNVDFGVKDYTEFESTYVKKKVSTKDSAFNWQTGEIDSSKLSFSQTPARTAEKGSNPRLDSLRSTIATEQYRQETADPTVQDYQSRTREQQALETIRERRGTDYSSSAADIAKGRIDISGKQSATPLEALHSAASQMSFGDWLDESTPSYNIDQRTAAEFNAFSKALSDENREVGLAIKGIEFKMKQEYGTDMADYSAMVSQFNTFQSSAKKLVDGFDKLPNDKKTQQEADRINAEVAKIQEQATELQSKLEEFSSTPEFKEMSKLYEVSNINTKRYEEELKTGKYDHAQQFGKYLEYRQSLKDESYKKMNSFEKAVSATGTVILHSLAKVPQSVAALTDVVEKSVGLEGETKGAGDVLQDVFIGLGDDIQAAFPAPTKLQRGGFTDTAKWGDYQVDFTADGDIQAIRDKDGYLQKSMLSSEQETEIKALKKERQFNSQSFAYQAGSTIADVAVQILGAKGMGGIKALPGVVGTSWGVPRVGMKALGTQFGMVATTAGMMANDLYKEGLENGLTEDDAARYALATGTAIGLVGTLAGVGIEEQLLLKSKLPSIGLRSKMPGFVGRKAYDVVTGGLGEVAEEIVLEKMAQAGVQYAMNEMSGGKFDIDPYKDTTSIINEGTTAFFAGGLFGFAKKGGKPSKMELSMLSDGAKDIPKTIEMVKDVATSVWQPLTTTEEEVLTKELETTKAAIEKIPEEQKTNPAVVELQTEATKIEEKIISLEEGMKNVGAAFQQDAKNEVDGLKVELAKVNITIAKESDITPNEKDVKLLEAQEESVSQAGPAKEGKVLEAPATAEPTTPEPLTGKAAKDFAEQNIDKNASLQDTDLSNISDEEVTRKVLEEGSPLQVGQAWSVEPNVVQGEVFSKESAIEEAVTNSTFDPRALEGIPDISSAYFPKEGKKANVNDLSELAEELSEQTGTNITEADIADYIQSNPQKKKPKKIKSNPNKRLLAQKFKELTGVAPTQEYIDKLSAAREKQQVEAEFPEAGDKKPVQSSSDKMKKSLLNRVVADPLISLEVREKAKAGELDYTVLKDEHVNEVAEFEIRENMKSLDVKDGLAASVATAKNLLREAVDTKDSNVRETNGAIATAIILKSAFNFAENGMMAEALEAYDWLDSYSRGAGRQISSLRASASPEGVASSVAMKAFETQVRELSKKGKNATLDQMLKGLKAEIAKVRNGENMKAAKAEAGKKLSNDTKKKDLKAERSDILARIKAQIMDQSLGAVYDPEQQAEKAAQLLDNVGLLVRNLVESGITKVQEIYDNIVESMKSIGFSEEDSDRIAKDALLRTTPDERMETLPTGKAQKLLEVPLQGTVPAEEIESLEFKGRIPTGKQGKLLEVPEKSNVPTEHIESSVAENGTMPIGKEVKLLDKQAIIDEIVDKHYEEQNGMALWAKLKEAGLTEKEARTYENALAKVLEAKEKAAILRAVNNFKKQIQEEEIDGIMLHEKKWNGTVDKLAQAAYYGLLNDQNIAAAAAGYFGFTAIDAQDVVDIKFISGKMINGLSANAVVNANGSIIGYQPVGVPAPAGTTLQLVEQKSPELLARAQKEMKVKLLEIKKRNEGLMPILANELNTAIHMGALANTGTWLNVIVGTLTKLVPDLISISVASPVAAVRAIQEIRKSDAKNWKMGWGVLRGAFMDNFSHLENPEMQLDGQYMNAASLIEVAMVRGIAKYSAMYANATGIDKAKSFTKLVGAIFSQAYRIAIAPKAIDAQFTHPVTEFVRFMEAFNKQSKGLKFSEIVTKDFASKVSEYGMFTKKAWEIAQSQAAAEVAGMKASGKEVPVDFETRRAKEIIQQQVRREEIKSAQLFMDQASLRGEMTGFLGVGYDKMQRSMRTFFREDSSPIAKLAMVIPRAAVTLFMRVAIHGTNIVQKTVPLLGPIMNATSHIMVNRSLAGVISSKFVGTTVMKEYPIERQIGNGYVTKSDTENAKAVGEQVMAAAVFSMLFMSMFDIDDEDNVMLDPDRWIDISASLDNDPFTTEVGGMTRYSIRFRQSDGSWGKPKKFSLWLPFMAPLSVLGGLRDDIMFREEELRQKSVWARGGASMNDIIGVFSEVSFNSLFQTIDRYQKAGAAAAKSDTPMPWVDVTFQTALRPTKAVIPGVYRDVLVNELGILLDEPAKRPKRWYEQVMKDIPWLDYYIKGDRFDEYGNLIYRDSKLGKMAERISMGFVDFVMKNEETRERPEWKLSSKYEGLITPGQYFPEKSLKLKKDGELGKKGDVVTDEIREEISRKVAERKGLVVNKYYSQLNKMKKDELEQMLQGIHNFAADIIKFEMGYSDAKKAPKFKFSDKLESVKDKIKEDED